MFLDLTKDGVLTLENSLLLNRIALELRTPFIILMQELGKGKEDSLDWWVSDFANIQTDSNSLFVKCCYAIMVDQLLKKYDDIEGIIVDSRDMYILLNSIVRTNNKNIEVKLKHDLIEILKVKFISRIILYLRLIYRIFQITIQWYSAYNSKTVARSIGDNITIVDIFVFTDSFVNGEFYDRYYDNFGGIIGDKLAKSIWYFPTFINVKKTSKIFKNMRNAKQNFLIKEDFLKFHDYFFALMFFFRAKTKIPANAILKGINISPLLIHAWNKTFPSYGSVDALLKFCLAKRINKRGISVRLVIDWFENQNIDKGLIIGFRKYYPQTKIIGYQLGIDHPFLLSYYPTRQQFDSKVLPHTVAVTGKKFVNSVKRFVPELDVIVVPAFRNKNVWCEKKSHLNPNLFTILILLPITLFDCREILNLLDLLPLDLFDRSLCLKIKLHPSYLNSEFDKLFKLKNRHKFELAKGMFYDNITTSDLVVGSNSSALVESIALGIPVVIVGSRKGLTQNPIPEHTDKDLYKVCYTLEEIICAIKYYSTFDEGMKQNLLEAGRRIREEFFEPVTIESSTKLLELYS